jgi:hypothetical protein
MLCLNMALLSRTVRNMRRSRLNDRLAQKMGLAKRHRYALQACTMPIVEIYKGHEIYASAWAFPDVTDEWEPRVLALHEDIRNDEIIRVPNFTQRFSSREEAEREALAFVKGWIDEGKPPLWPPMSE